MSRHPEASRHGGRRDRRRDSTARDSTAGDATRGRQHGGRRDQRRDTGQAAQPSLRSGFRFVRLVRCAPYRRAGRNPVVVTTMVLGALGCDNHGVGGGRLDSLGGWQREGLSA
jgi:hypothetical protein